MQMNSKLKIGIDIDGVCNSEYSTIFSAITTALKKSSNFEIFIISARNNSQKAKQKTIQELKELGIVYDYLILTDDKQQAIKENSINIFVDNQIENFQQLNSDVCCLLIREEGNYCYKSFRFLGNNKTTKMID
jgi:uncharacterized HAD superfamily protein